MPPNPFYIRPATVNDVAAVKKLLLETWIDTYSHFVPVTTLKEITDAWHAPEKLTREIAGGAAWFVAETKTGDLLGVASAHAESVKEIKIDRLYVLPAHQGKGVGKALSLAVLKEFPDAKTARLEVEEKNPKARSFYGRLGYKEVQVVRQDLGPVEAWVVVMQKSLP